MIVGLPGLELDGESRRILELVQPAGVILFRRNVANVSQLKALVSAIREVVPTSLLMVDAEGGRVDRLAPAVGAAPGAAAVAGGGDRLARRAGLWIGASLAAFDLDVDLAPVIDLDSGETDNALAQRTWGTEADQVTARGAAFLEGLFESGVVGCIKHFPGLGAATKDTHHHGAEIRLDEPAAAVHLEPFRRLALAAGAVMVSHASYPHFDPEGRPASVSPPIVTGLLRERLGFGGVTISDDLEMHALAPIGGLPERAVAAVRAGCDLAAVCARLDQAEAVARALEQRVAQDRWTEAAARVERWRTEVADLRARRFGGRGAAARARRGLARLRAAVVRR
jgi:beta-N-acetylhexosaminidase